MNAEEKQREDVRRYWDGEAATFDREPDHGLGDPDTRRAWRDLLVERLPTPPARVLDVGCGTGSLGLLLAEQGYEVSGIDLSPAMVEQARAKCEAAGHSIPLAVMDAAHPHFSDARFDAILCRHLLWALPEPDRVLRRWLELLQPGGHLLLIEGYWHTGGGLHAQDVVDLLPRSLTNISVEDLSQQTALWGHPVHDERYIVTAHRADELD